MTIAEQHTSGDVWSCLIDNSPAYAVDAALVMLALPYGRFSALAEVCGMAASWKRDPRTAPNSRYSARARRLVGAVIAACAPTAEDCENAFYRAPQATTPCEARAERLFADADALDGLVRLLGDLRDVLRAVEEHTFGAGGATGTRMLREVAPSAPDQQDYAEAGGAPALMVSAQDDTPSASTLSSSAPTGGQ